MRKKYFQEWVLKHIPNNDNFFQVLHDSLPIISHQTAQYCLKVYLIIEKYLFFITETTRRAAKISEIFGYHISWSLFGPCKSRALFERLSHSYRVKSVLNSDVVKTVMLWTKNSLRFATIILNLMQWCPLQLMKFGHTCLMEWIESTALVRNSNWWTCLYLYYTGGPSFTRDDCCKTFTHLPFGNTKSLSFSYEVQSCNAHCCQYSPVGALRENRTSRTSPRPRAFDLWNNHDQMLKIELLEL